MHSTVLLVLWTAIATAAAAFVLRLLGQKRASKAFATQHQCLAPPREQPWDILGLVNGYRFMRALMSHRMVPRVTQLLTKHNGTFDFRILGQRIVMTCSAPNLRQIQIANFSDYNSAIGLRDHVLGPLMPDSIMVMDGPAWHKTRPLYRSLLFSVKRVFDTGLLQDVFEKFESRIMAADGAAVDVQPLLSAYFMDVYSDWLLGQPGALLTDNPRPEMKKFHDHLSYAATTSTRNGHYPWMLLFTDRTKYKTACQVVHESLDLFMDEAAARQKTQAVQDSNVPPLVDTMLSTGEDRAILRNTLLSFFVAGADTVASVVGAAIWLLSRHPDVWQKLRSEVVDAVGFEAPTHEQLRSMKHLRNVVSESLRLCGPVPYNGKIANTKTWLPTGGGRDGKARVFVDQGDVLIYSPWVSHRNSDSFGPDAEQFRPDRWNNMEPECLAGFTPFNLGPRACPGQHLALAQTYFFLSRLAQTYGSITTTDKREWSEQLDSAFALKNKNGVPIVFKH